MKKRVPFWLIGVLIVASVLVLGTVDWATGYKLSFFVFYFLPISIAAWYFGFAPSVIVSALSALIWFGADSLAGREYASSGHAVWNTMIRLLSFLAIGWPVSKVHWALDRERQTADGLRRALAEIKVLETFLPICAQCKKIRNQQGVWQHMEVYIGEHSNTHFSHGYCPECARRAMAEAGLLDDKTEPEGSRYGVQTL